MIENCVVFAIPQVSVEREGDLVVRAHFPRTAPPSIGIARCDVCEFRHEFPVLAHVDFPVWHPDFTATWEGSRLRVECTSHRVKPLAAPVGYN